MKNYYQILQINSSSSDKEIKHAYRVLTAKYHPDKHQGSTEHIDLFHSVKEAYDILSIPEKRAEYDKLYKIKFPETSLTIIAQEEHKYPEIIDQINFIKTELGKLKPSNAINMSSEDIEKSIIVCNVKLNEIKSFLSEDHQFYLILNEHVVLNYLSIVDELNKYLFEFTVFSPEEGMEKYSPYEIAQIVISGLENTLKYVVIPINNYNLNTHLRALYDLKILFINDIIENFPTGEVPDDSGYCYIATMVYGDYDNSNVIYLRLFRDQILAKRLLGRWFIQFYYQTSPTFVSMLKDNKRANAFIKCILDKFSLIIKNKLE